MIQVTAKVKCTRKEPRGGASEVRLEFQPDYQDGRNKEWAAATPALSLTMTVKASVAKHFEQGAPYTLTFAPDSALREG